MYTYFHVTKCLFSGPKSEGSDRERSRDVLKQVIASGNSCETWAQSNDEKTTAAMVEDSGHGWLGSWWRWEGENGSRSVTGNFGSVRSGGKRNEMLERMDMDEARKILNYDLCVWSLMG